MTAPHRIAAILGTRPEAIKLAPVIAGLQTAPDFEVEVVLTGQHREMVDQVMQLFHLKADVNLDIMQPGQTLTDITERSLRGLETYFQQANPDLAIVQGDTTTAFAAALAAFYRQIPIGHVEAGLRTDDLFNPYPEEANRRLISQLASLNFAPTDRALANLKASSAVGTPIKTGNTVIDALLAIARQDLTPPVPQLNWNDRRILLATVHRRENWGDPLKAIATAFRTLLDRFPDTALLLPLHRNPTVRDPLNTVLANHPRAHLVEPLSYGDLVAALQHCTLILSDSGGIQEEAPALGKPVLVLRQTTERPEAIAAGTARLVGTDPEAIVAAASELLSDPEAYARMAKAANPFGDGRATERILTGMRQWFARQTTPANTISVQ
ncbi:non-hydrolyzing UDP-N-acetylglucosamine 2-epimerase [Synechococcus sp. PCC 7336]|uniref:non-hydrolyzing UDP-N-acetylglucosamine 2-epimerase n=1 Tax=Synechococcus sp. PCC 7336 TaxID=195250 RepID=UPI0003495CDE|nr:UDP-N-acetylglucosamine 2-epimerase (non-hydrolyzing) [Synechococcus sp. PCC 7336]